MDGTISISFSIIIATDKIFSFNEIKGVAVLDFYYPQNFRKHCRKHIFHETRDIQQFNSTYLIIPNNVLRCSICI